MWQCLTAQSAQTFSRLRNLQISTRFGVPIPGGAQGRAGHVTQSSGVGTRWGLGTVWAPWAERAFPALGILGFCDLILIQAK